MFPSWLSDGFNNAVNGASNAFNNFFHGSANPSPANPAPAAEPSPQETQTQENPQTPTDTVNEEPPSVEDVSEPTLLPKGGSLSEELHFLQIEAMQYAEKKAKDAYLKLKNSFENNQALTQLLQTITNQSDQNGNFNADSDEIKKMFRAAKASGVKIPEGKLAFTKDERDSLVRNIELQKQTVELDIRLRTNEAQESIQQRNIWFQEMKSVLDKIAGAIKKCSDNIR
jgi:hypothetical protein